MSAPENDANLCGDMRALVVVLREIRDEGRRCADALERIAKPMPEIAGALEVLASEVPRIIDAHVRAL